MWRAARHGGLVSGSTRRRIVFGTGVLVGLALAGRLGGSRAASAPRGAGRLPGPPFTLGVASGDPLSDGFVLWTRLAPQPLEPTGNGGMPPHPYPVQWQVATDEQLRHVVQQGTAMALPELAHAVHVEVHGLEPARPYWYRFRAGAEWSPIGCTRTTPAAGAAVPRLRFAFASCQNYQSGYFTAYRHLAEEELDLVVHLGDYIYEYGPDPSAPRRHDGPAPVSLGAYRKRYALYKSDPDLQRAHAAFPWIVTWDDHEVDNNYASEIPEGANRSGAAGFLARRAAAYQAYYEHQPLRLGARPQGPHLALYRRLTYGTLAEFNVLDTRQYRSDQPICRPEERLHGYCPTALDPQRTILGDEQKRWLLDGLDRSVARWNILAQQVLMARHDQRAGAAREFNGDNWDGYAADRAALLDFLAQRRPANPLVITGDVHQNRVYDLKADFDDPDSATLATELVGTSISSGGDVAPNTAYSFADNPHQKFRNSSRGYVRCDVTAERWQADFRVVSTVRRRDAPVSTVASFVVQAGQPGAQRA